MSSTNQESQYPRHVAIIMDGNGRWAAKKGLPRTAGHKKGVDAVKRVVEAAADLGIEYLTLFGFSSENWSRPKEEVGELMRLLRYYLKAEMAELHKNNIRLKVIGAIDQFDSDIKNLIKRAEELTENNSKLTLVIALNYGGKQDILRAAMKLSKEAVEVGKAFTDKDEALAVFERHLYTAGMPDPDLLIRTSGEKRVSNFLLWQCAYSEMVFTDIFWPEFDKYHLESCINEYMGRERRFGNVHAKG